MSTLTEAAETAEPTDGEKQIAYLRSVIKAKGEEIDRLHAEIAALKEQGATGYWRDRLKQFKAERDAALAKAEASR